MHMVIIEYIWKRVSEVHLETGGGVAEVCSPGCVVPSALSHVWLFCRYVASRVFPVWPPKCSLSAGLYSGVWSPLCFGFLSFLCVKVAICACSPHCLCNPCRPQTLAPFVCTFCEARKEVIWNPIQTRAGKYIFMHFTTLAGTQIYSTHTHIDKRLWLSHT